MENIADILQLLNSEGIGAVSFYKYVDKFGSVKAALDNINPKKRTFSKTEAEDEIAKAEKKNIKIIAYDSPLYPQSLLHIADAPPILYALGNTELLNHSPNIAMSVRAMLLLTDAKLPQESPMT